MPIHGDARVVHAQVEQESLQRFAGQFKSLELLVNRFLGAHVLLAVFAKSQPLVGEILGGVKRAILVRDAKFADQGSALLVLLLGQTQCLGALVQ